MKRRAPEPRPVTAPVDAVLVGAGIMTATLATMLHRLQPDWSITILERLPDVAMESSDPWNNAGTGHAALCELNYTPQAVDGTINVDKALQINEQFQISRQWWSALVREGTIADPGSFISSTPHMAMVRGTDDVGFLRRRYEALRGRPLFDLTEYSEDPEVIRGWAPLIVDGRDPAEPLAATRDTSGTDVNFGSLTRQLLDGLRADGVQVLVEQEVEGLRRRPDEPGWLVDVRDRKTQAPRSVPARFVFVGAGGWSLKLLHRAGLPEAEGYGLLPVSGQFLRSEAADVVARHRAKVYGNAPAGAPPMSMPHLDARRVDGGQYVLFGPYAGSSPRFLKKGSLLDLPLSLRRHNIVPLLGMARDNIPLLRILVRELAANRKRRIGELRKFVPGAREQDWELIHAGQRAQIVKRDAKRGGVLQFGTEVITAADRSVSAVLGASPGASTAVPIMLELLERCFPDRWQDWSSQLREQIPTLGRSLSDDPELASATRAATADVLGLTA